MKLVLDKDVSKMAATEEQLNAGPVTALAKLRSKRAKMIAHLNLKVEEGDWHGVADAAMDLREIEVAIAYEK